MDHEVVPCQMTFFHGHTSMVNLCNMEFLKALGLSLGGNRTWTKRSDHAPKSRSCLCLYYIIQSGSFGEFFFCMFHLLHVSPSFLFIMIKFGEKIKMKQIEPHSPITVPWLLQQENLFLSHCKTFGP